MNIPEELIVELPNAVKSRFYYWRDYMYNNISFNLINSEIHSQDHCERVLLFSLIIGHELFGESEEKLSALAHASIFHDSRRESDGYDTGHGERAAEYYRSFCSENGLKYYPISFEIMTYHDLDDKRGEKVISNKFMDESKQMVTLYQILKDADALDRFRFRSGPNIDFIRLEESRALFSFAKKLVHTTLRFI